MGINLDKPRLWEEDIGRSVDFYNEWFMEFAPKTFRDTRILTAKSVEEALRETDYLNHISPDVLENHPEVLPILRMSTCPPIARDRLVGLAGVTKSLVKNMEDAEKPRVSPKKDGAELEKELQRISDIIIKMADPDIFTWLSERRSPNPTEIMRATTIVVDRLCGTVADPIIRNAQEKRQLAAIEAFLKGKGYVFAESGVHFNEMLPGTFSFHTIVPAYVSRRRGNTVNISVDVAIMPFSASPGELPLMIEAKSSGDYTNVNKRRKEEFTKMQQLKNTYGKKVSFSLFLCGYFNHRYLAYEKAKGIDWIWEHRISDMEQLGILKP